MSQKDHKIIEDCTTKAQKLVAAIDKYKASAELNQSSTESLEAVAKAIKRTAGDLAPLSEYRIKMILYIFGGGCLANTLLLLAIFITVLVK